MTKKTVLQLDRETTQGYYVVLYIECVQGDSHGFLLSTLGKVSVEPCVRVLCGQVDARVRPHDDPIVLRNGSSSSRKHNVYNDHKYRSGQETFKDVETVRPTKKVYDTSTQVHVR